MNASAESAGGAAAGRQAAPAGEARRLSFGAAGELVLRRVVLRRWLGVLRRGALAGGVVMAGLMVWAGLGGGLAVFWLGLAGLVAAAGGALIWQWRGRPSVYAALALWDREAGRREAFAAAWWFEGRVERTLAEAVHWQAQLGRLPDAMERMKGDLPLPDWRRLAGVPVALILTGVLGWWAEARMREPVLTTGMVAVAREEAAALTRVEVAAEKLEALSENDRAALEESMKAAVEALENSAGKTAREVMDGLEQQARETEKLAERLGKEGEEWASPELTEGLRRQADTADLGDAVADRRAAAAAEAADELAEKMTGAGEEQEARLNEVFEEVVKQARPEDPQRLVGAGVTEAASQLKAGQAPGAAEAMRSLAEQLRERGKRERTQEELERLAQQLREAGSRVASAQEGGAMQSLAQQEGQKPGGGQQQAGQETPGAGQVQPGGGQPGGESMALAPPGLGQEPPSGQQGAEDSLMSLSPPDPSAGRGGDEKGDAPRLMAPVPGEKPGEDGAPLVLGAPGAPAGGGAFIGGGSGLPPGVGKAELNAEETEAMDSSKQSMANAQKTGEGTSAIRQVEGGAPREEAVGRSASALAVEFLEAQEAALDEAALPAGRREQVRRYFNELRRRFEKEK